MTRATGPSPVVELFIDGVRTRAAAGQTIAALLIALDAHAWGRVPEAESRRARCGIGTCNDCVVTVDGVPRVKACLMPVQQGMQILTRRKVS
ncbi:(2Fe-2S)-binding protein [Streptomyces sp. NPDC017964]|uniref:(2Fe-2S)-binding protein n=1 Tax=Streptomyces sp. NPDC017964 TaxID=3365022 RepID=UPI00379059D2